MLDQIIALERSLGVSLITPELQACAFLYRNGPAPSHHLQGAVRTSPAGFHNVKRRLLERGIIVGSRSSHDARVTLYDLTDGARHLVDTSLQELRGGPAHPFSAQAVSLSESRC